MGTAVKLSDAPFRSADHALSVAYEEEARVICKIGTAIADLRGGSVRARAPETPHDRLAQASFTLSLMRRSLPTHLSDALDAYYTAPAGISLEGRKELACRSLSYHLWEDMGRIPDRWYLCDVVRGWTRHNRRLYDEGYWAKRCSTTPRTLRHWRKGWSEQTGAIDRLNALLDAARSRVQDVFEEAGICGS